MGGLTGDGCRGLREVSLPGVDIAGDNGVFIVRADPDAAGQAALAATQPDVLVLR